MPAITTITKHYVVTQPPDVTVYNYYYVDDNDIIITVDDRDTVNIHADGDLTITDSFNEDNDITVIEDSFNQDNDGVDNKGGTIDDSVVVGDDMSGSNNSDDDTTVSQSHNTVDTETNTDLSSDTTVDASYNDNTFDNDGLDIDAGAVSMNTVDSAAIAATNRPACGRRRMSTRRQSSTPPSRSPSNSRRPFGTPVPPARRVSRTDTTRERKRMRRSEPVAVLEQALSTIAPYRRPDLEERLRQSGHRLRTDRVRVLVVGEFKQGKSLLVNGLVRAPVCPVFDDVATSVPTVVRYAEKPTAALVRVVEAARDGEPPKLERVELPIEELATHIAETGNPGNKQGWRHAEIGIPRALLAGGLEIVDTPGVGGLNSMHGAATMAELPTADAVLFVSDASQEYTAPELEFLRQATKFCPNVLCVLSKTDLYPEWERIADLDRGHLTAAGIDAELLTVSSALRVHAIRTDDDAADAESGFPVLISYLRDRVVSQADVLARRSTAHDIVAVTEQLATALLAEQTSYTDPEAAAHVIRELTEAKQHAAALKERSARWQHTLSDGVADLNADIDYDLRDRMRDIVREAEEEVNRAGDPRKIWDQLSAWVEQEVQRGGRGQLPVGGATRALARGAGRRALLRRTRTCCPRSVPRAPTRSPRCAPWSCAPASRSASGRRRCQRAARRLRRRADVRHARHDRRAAR